MIRSLPRFSVVASALTTSGETHTSQLASECDGMMMRCATAWGSALPTVLEALGVTVEGRRWRGDRMCSRVIWFCANAHGASSSHTSTPVLKYITTLGLE